MPTINVAPRTMSNGQTLIAYADSVGTTNTVFTFPTRQEWIKIANKGNADLIVTVGTFSNQTIQPGQIREYVTLFSNFTIRSASKVQHFEILADDSYTPTNVVLRPVKVPTTATDAGKKGDIAFDTGFLYICVSDNVWRRVATLTW